jgi:hypothetical protein
VRILQREKKTLLTVIHLPAVRTVNLLWVPMVVNLERRKANECSPEWCRYISEMSEFISMFKTK